MTEARTGAEAGPRQRVWHIRAGQVVLATGAHERPIVFADNDRPGIMLASAVRTYLGRYGVVAGTDRVLRAVEDFRFSPDRIPELGRTLLAHGIDAAWTLAERHEAPATQRVWVHTCSLDGPAALRNYERRGFVVIDETTELMDYPAQPLGAWRSAGGPA